MGHAFAIAQDVSDVSDCSVVTTMKSVSIFWGYAHFCVQVCAVGEDLAKHHPLTTCHLSPVVVRQPVIKVLALREWIRDRIIYHALSSA